MTTQPPTSITIQPIVSYPREAEPGKTYLMTVDLRFPVGKEEWPYEEEEHEIYCLLDSAPLFDNEELGEAIIVLHRFGGTYGPAMFLLTANAIEMSEPVGAINLTLTNRQLMPLQVFKLDKIRVSTKSTSTSATVAITRQQPVAEPTQPETGLPSDFDRINITPLDPIRIRDFVAELVQRESEREEITATEQALLSEKLAEVAYAMQSQRAPDAKLGDDEAGNALTVLPKADVSKFLDERLLRLASSASLLSVGEQVRFTHQLLQEYFAARYMQIKLGAGQLDPSALWPSDRWWKRTNWEEAAFLLAGLYSDDCSRIVEWVAEANPEVAAQCVIRSGAALPPASRDALRERLRKKWIDRLTDLKNDPQPEARAAIGRALGLMDWDNRKGVGTVEESTADGRSVMLPDIDWVEIPGGEFQYGDESKYAAKPRKLTLPTFHISRYPVTYAQFQTFLDDPEGYADPRWFEGLAASDDERQMSEPYFKFENHPFTNHPRDSVRWYQAMAFCRWLSWRWGGGYDLKKVAEWAVRLPTEFEWERAARGTDGRLYPYGNDYDAAKGNTRETGIGQTSAVGIFPDGASPDGVMDMSGKVWEWCLSNHKKPALDARKEKLTTNANRAPAGRRVELPSSPRACRRSELLSSRVP